MDNNANRKIWIDAFKAITICLVVIGHATGRFNQYIYQFHMPAFFFISGYCTDWTKRGRLQLVWERFCNLLIPFLSIFFVGVFGMWLLNLTGMYHFFFSEEMIYIGVWKIVRELFANGNNYVYWMGATWFIWILFLVIIYHAFISCVISDDKPWRRYLYLTIVVLTYLLGFEAVQEGVRTQYVLVAIGQLYFGIGNFCRDIRYEKILEIKGNFFYIIGIFFSTLLIWKFSKISGITVDFPSFYFQHVLLNVAAALNGIFWVFCFSQIIEQVGKYNQLGKIINKVSVIIGANTMPIMYFHFCFFKLSMLMLALAGIVEKSYLKNLLPNQNGIGERYLWLFTLVSVAGSVIIWKLLNSITFLRIILGQEKDLYKKAFNYLGISKIETKIKGKKRDIFSYLTAKQINKESRQQLTFKLTILVLFVNFGINVIRQGIICNDEVQHYYNRILGWKNLLKWAMSVALSQGRPLRIPADFNVALFTLFQNVYANRLFQVLLLGLTAYAFYKLIMALFNEKIIGYIWLILVFSFWPITFEHGTPNAFNGLTAVPVLELIITLIFWCNYLKSGKKKYYFGMLFLWLLALGGYEFIVTYTPLFLILYLFLRDQKKKTFFDMFRVCFAPGMFGVLYLVGTFVCQKLFGAGYEGVQMSFSNPRDIIKVLSILVRCAFPGAFPILSKYKYLLSLYRPNINTAFLLSGLLVTMIIGVLIFFAGKTDLLLPKQDRKPIKTVFILCSIISYIIIPVLPNAVTKLYQENVSFQFFSWLPISLPVFFTNCFLVAFIISELIKKWNRGGIAALGLIVLALGSDTQYMNRIISNQNHIDYERFSDIQKVFQTESLKQLGDVVIGTDDLYESRNLLSIHQDYWTNYNSILGNKAKVKTYSNSDATDYDLWMSFVNDEYFSMVGDSTAAIISKNTLRNHAFLEISSNECIAVPVGSYWQDGKFYVYSYNRVNGEWVAGGAENNIFENFVKQAGNTKDTMVPEKGIYDDFWCSKNSRFRISSGNTGQIILSMYYPEYEEEKDCHVKVTIDDQEPITQKLSGQTTVVTLETEPETEHKIQIETDFFITDKGNDIRELSWILQEVIGQ